MGNSNTVLAAETNQPITPPPPPIGTQSPVDTPTSQSVISPVSNNPGVFEDLHKKCKGKNSLDTDFSNISSQARKWKDSIV